MTAQPARYCVALVSHVLNPPVRAVFDRLQLETPPGYDVRMIFSTDDSQAGLAGLHDDVVDRISVPQIFQLPYPMKCQLKNWEMAGNLDLVFLEFFRRHPDYDRYWFVEYDVFWQGHWSVFFDYFHSSPSDLLAATIHRADEVPHKAEPKYPSQFIPKGMKWERENVIKAFLPICRLSHQALAALDRAYRAGLGGHYEINVPSVLAQIGLVVEDFGGNGAFVHPDNVNRFYFAAATPSLTRPGRSFFARPSTSYRVRTPFGIR